MNQTYASRAIRRIRNDGRMTCQEIADYCGVSRQSVYKWIAGLSCLEHNEKKLGELVKRAIAKQKARSADKLALHIREAETHLALAAGIMGDMRVGGDIVWVGSLPEYHKVVKTMLRVREIKERVEWAKQRYERAAGVTK